MTDETEPRKSLSPEKKAERVQSARRAWAAAGEDVAPRTPHTWELPPGERAKRSAEAKKAWWASNPDYKARYRDANREYILAQGRDRERRRYSAKKRQEARKAANRERAARWRAANPERAREYARRFRLENPERVKASRQAYYSEHREEILERARRRRELTPTSEAQRAAEKRWREGNAERKAEIQRRYRSDPEVRARINEAYAARRRLKRRLEAAGLPPAKLRRTPAVQQRQNEAAATEFFARAWRRDESRRLLKSYHFEPTPPAVAAEFDRRARARWRWREHVERYQEAFAEHLAKHGARIREEVRMDSRARELRGLAPLDVGSEVARRVALEVHRAHPTDIGRLYARVLEARRRPRPEAGNLARLRAASFPSAPVASGRPHRGLPAARSHREKGNPLER